MGDERAHGAPRLTEQQEAVVASDEGALLVLGVAGSGRSEALAGPLPRLVGQGERALALTRAVAAARPPKLPAPTADETAHQGRVVPTPPPPPPRPPPRPATGGQ